MYAKVAFLLLGFAVAAFGETCTCGRLKACVEANDDLRHKSQAKCASRCRNKLPGDADQLQQCMKEKSDGLEKVKEHEIDCLLNPAEGTCTAPRARRQSDPRNFFVQPSASDFQPESNRGKWIRPGAQTEIGIGARVDADVLLKPYYDCTHSCMQEMHPEKGEGLASGANQGAVDPIGRHLTAIQECQLKEKCTIDVASLANAVRTSCQSDSEDALSFKQDIKLSFCRCIRDVLQKTETEMPCMPDADGGRSKGGRSD
jgi:hypothetical protein